MLGPRSPRDGAASAGSGRDNTRGTADDMADAAPGSAAPRAAAAGKNVVCGTLHGGANAASASAAPSERHRSWALQAEPDRALRRAARTPQAPWRTLEALTLNAAAARGACTTAVPAAPAAQLPGTASRGPPVLGSAEMGTTSVSLSCNMAAPISAVPTAEQGAASRARPIGKENAPPPPAVVEGLVGFRAAEGGPLLLDPGPALKSSPCQAVRRLAMQLQAVREHEAAQAALNPTKDPVAPKSALVAAAPLGPRCAPTWAGCAHGMSAGGWALPGHVRAAEEATDGSGVGTSEAACGHVGVPAQRSTDLLLEVVRQGRCGDGGEARLLTQMSEPPGKGWQPGRVAPVCDPSGLPEPQGRGARQDGGAAAAVSAAGPDSWKGTLSANGPSSATVSTPSAGGCGVVARRTGCSAGQSGAACVAGGTESAGEHDASPEISADIGGSGGAARHGSCGTQQSSTGWEPSIGAEAEQRGWEARARDTESACGGVFSGLRVAVDPRLPAEHSARRAGCYNLADANSAGLRTGHASYESFVLLSISLPAVLHNKKPSSQAVYIESQAAKQGEGYHTGNKRVKTRTLNGNGGAGCARRWRAGAAPRRMPIWAAGGPRMWCVDRRMRPRGCAQARLVSAHVTNESELDVVVRKRRLVDCGPAQVPTSRVCEGRLRAQLTSIHRLRSDQAVLPTA